jgi:hypothetical protein
MKRMEEDRLNRKMWSLEFGVWSLEKGLGLCHIFFFNSKLKYINEFNIVFGYHIALLAQRIKRQPSKLEIASSNLA